MVNADPTEDPPVLCCRCAASSRCSPASGRWTASTCEVRAGEVHCLLGQNGAGKSTLIKVLAGAHQPDEGEILVDGEPVTHPHPVAALKHGIATIYQELDLVDWLSVAENIFLGHELAPAASRSGAPRRARDPRAALRLGHREISPHREVGPLSAAGKQIVSMARALSRDARLIVMDEPSAVLDREEVENLFHVVRELTARASPSSTSPTGSRRSGRSATGSPCSRTAGPSRRACRRATTPTSELIRLMTGRSIEYVFPPRRPRRRRRGAAAAGRRARAARGVQRRVASTVRAGEIVGLAGLVGAGRSEILETIFGARERDRGTVAVDGRDAARRVGARGGRGRRRAVPRGAQEPGPDPRRGRLPEHHAGDLRAVRRGAVPRRGRRALGAPSEQIDALDVRPADPDRAVRTLSGGNQQKVVLARWLLTAAGCCCWTSPPAASTSAPAPRSTC